MGAENIKVNDKKIKQCYLNVVYLKDILQYCVHCPEGNKKYQSKIGHICQTRSKAQFTICVPESPSMCPMFNTCPLSFFTGI